MNRHEIIEHSNAAELAVAVAAQVRDTLTSAIADEGETLAFVPGGSTPKVVFPLLARESIDWDRVTLVPGDERVAPRDSGYSNYATVSAAFENTSATILPLADGGDCAEAAERADALLHSLRWPADLVWLGMGTDGHIASIFPGRSGAKALTCETTHAVCVHPDPLPPEAPFPRVSLTLPAILSAGAIVIAATGEAKKEVLDKALAGGADGLPIAALFRQARQTVTIHWSPA